ncbi:MAG TPA: bifunctional serine/threonine-protein kinase/formylglycine-generating enzyme family protein [Acidobacteriaceae bacterium]|nr:bifunctional serine/threonine-protein kinase/formylglycine-generating enzyme family protein [Acidobacteriaceae bacterium]
MSRVEDQCAELSRALGEKYEVIRRIGGGGMAEVYLARHAAHGALFAVKVLAENLARNERVVARFEEEARLEARLSGHPNIVPIYDIGAADGLHYIVMPYIQGEDLASLVRRVGRLRPNDAANLVAQVAEALSWAEDKGVVHRDLKPANIRLDTSGRAIVVDFGIAKASQGSGELTLPGEGLGTPFYMSPEQFLGEVCDPRSDLYSLGIVFFEFLTGQRPFSGDSFPAIQKAHLSPARPSIRSHDPGLPATYDQLIQKLLQIDPANRLQSPKELLAILSRLGVHSGRSTLVPEFDQVAHSEKTRISPASQQPTTGAARTHRRWQVITAVTLVTVTMLLGIAALLVLNRPKKILSDPAGSMVLVPAGDFIFGDNSPISPNPRKQLALKAFYVDQTEVSNAQYKRFCDATGHAPPGSSDFLAKPDFPVTDVTLADAQAYATWAGKQLPTEEQWEKSARGADGRPYPWGWDPWTQDLPHQLQQVDSFKTRQSPVGALNMAGNVFEWTRSPFPAGTLEYADMEKQLGSSAFSRKWFSIKGGSFSPRSDPRLLLAYMRRGFPEDQRSPYIGFRCVRDVPESTLWGKLKSLLSK